MIKIYGEKEINNGSIFDRSEKKRDVSGAVAEIIAGVREKGDRALIGYAEKFDGVRLGSLRVTEEEIDAAFARVEPEFIRILERAASNIKRFHEKQIRRGFEFEAERGVVLGQKIVPVEKAGVYVPGGTAAYPSTVLMDTIPAKLAGVKNVIMTTPPGKDGKVPDVILAAAKLCGVDTVFRSGGAQAIAALAYGTESVPKVDKIVGPGNAYVAEAKRQVSGDVSIDMIAGPSEILIISDGNTDPAVLAADMLSQAEHDGAASAVLVTVSEELAERTARQLEIQLPLLPRENTARASIENNGKIIVADSLDKAVEISNALAPEHLELCVDDPFALLAKIRCAGSVFLGKNCPEPLGDYLAGTNHTLPTGGTARFSSPLSVDDFIKKIQFSYFTREALSAYKDDVAYFAEKEGLTAHARSALIRDEIK